MSPHSDTRPKRNPDRTRYPPRTELASRRVSLGYTQQGLGEALGVAPETVAAWERGVRTPNPDKRPRLANTLQVSLAEVDRLIEPGAGPPVLNGHRVPVWLSHYESLVEAAGSLAEVEPVAIPGLLQTPEYAAVVERSTERVLSDREVQERVELRVARQAALRRETDPLHLTAVLPEHLLRTNVDHGDLMRNQLDHLLQLATLPNVELLVLVGDSQLGFVSGFQLLTKPGSDDPFMAVTLDVEGSHYVEDPDRVAKFVARFEHLVSNALSSSASIRYIEQTRGSNP
jgi:transcriptional regulator with XRE-family HTH domain